MTRHISEILPGVIDGLVEIPREPAVTKVDSPAKRKKPSTSPTQLTLAKWRKAGYRCAVVEKWNSHTKIRQDLFGCIDVLAIGNGETVGIQSTSDANVSARVRKIADMPEIVADLRDANWRIIVEGWKKPANRWVSREVDVS